MTACSLCREARGFWPTKIAASEYEGRGWLLDVTRRFAVVPSFGPLVAGHILVVPKDHRRNVLGGLAAGEEAEVNALIGRHFERLEQLAGAGVAMLCFEHGDSRNGGDGRCGTDHAHLHALPVSVSTGADVVTRLLGMGAARDCLDVVALPASESYLTAFVMTNAGGRIGIRSRATFVGPLIESQLIRRWVGEAERVPEWNWKHDFRSEQIRRTLDMVTPST